MSPYEENVLTFIYVLQNQPELLTAEDCADLRKLLATLPDDVEEISNAIALWYETHPKILDAILNVPIDDLDSLRAADGRSTSITGAESKEMIENSVTESTKSADGRSTPITGAESKEMIENSVTESTKSSQPDSSSETKKE